MGENRGGMGYIEWLISAKPSKKNKNHLTLVLIYFQVVDSRDPSSEVPFSPFLKNDTEDKPSKRNAKPVAKVLKSRIKQGLSVLCIRAWAFKTTSILPQHILYSSPSTVQGATGAI